MLADDARAGTLELGDRPRELRMKRTDIERGPREGDPIDS